MFLGEARARVEQQNPPGGGDAQWPVLTVAQVERRRGEEEHGDEELGLSDDAGDGLDVHRMHGEQRGGKPRGLERKEAPGHREHEDGRDAVEEDVRGVVRKRRSAAEDMLDLEGDDGDRAVPVGAPLLGPVRLSEHAPEMRELEHGRVSFDDVAVVVREAVEEADGRGDEGEERDGQRRPEAGALGHEKRLNFVMCQNAATPSRQPIFLPSA